MKNVFLTISFLLISVINLSFARDVSSLSKTQTELKYQDRLKERKQLIAPSSYIKNIEADYSFMTGFISEDFQKPMRPKLKRTHISPSLEVNKTSFGTMDTKSIVVIGGTITGVLKLQPSQEYHATSDVIVDGGYLIQEPGTVIKWAADTGLYVRNGGTYLAKGFPGALCTNQADVDPTPYPGYWKGILIEESASNNCEIKYSLIQDAITGIELRNKTLKAFIEYNIVRYCGVGIKAYGPKHTKITNNYCYNNQDSYWNGTKWVDYGTGIQCFYRSFEGIADPNKSVVNIEQNTCLWNYDEGIRVHMIDEYTTVSPVILNNVCAGNYWNYSFEDGLALANLVLKNGSWLDPEIPGSVHIYYFDPNDWGLILEDSMDPIAGFYSNAVFLNPNCAFIDAGLQNVLHTTYMGTTTSLDNTPDTGRIDLGYHNSNWDYSSAGRSTLKADIDNNLIVDSTDLSILADYWLFDFEEAYEVRRRDSDGSGVVDLGDLLILAEDWLVRYDFNTFAWFAQKWMEVVDSRVDDSRADIFPDGQVNMRDFSLLANEWQNVCDSDPNILINTTLDETSGYTKVGIDNYRPDTEHAFLFLNGCFVKDLFGFREGEGANLNLAELGGGQCELKVVSFNSDGRVTCSNIEKVEFSSPMEYLRCPETYRANEADYFCLSSEEPNNVCVKVFDFEENVLWTQTYPANRVIGFVPASITSNRNIGRTEFEMVEPTGGIKGITLMKTVLAKLPPTVRITKTVGFDPEDVPANVTSLIILPDNWVSWWVNRRVLNQVRATFDNEYELKGGEAVSTNIAWFAQNRNIKYIYYDGHGNFEFGGQLRTAIKLSDGICFSIRYSDYGGDPNYPPPIWCYAMGGGYEDGENLSFAQMGFHTLEYAYFDCCFSGRLKINGSWQLVEGEPGSQGILDAPYSDLSWVLGNPACQGWYDECVHGTYSTFSDFTMNEWCELQQSGETLYQALLFAIGKSRIDPKILEDPAENMRLKGLQPINELRID